MKKVIILAIFSLGVLLTAPLFSASSGGDDEAPESCEITINGNTIHNNLYQIVGCVNGGSNCTYTVSVPCN